MHNSLKRAVSIAIAAIALFSLPCGSIFARTHIDIDKKCSITVDIPIHGRICILWIFP